MISKKILTTFVALTALALLTSAAFAQQPVPPTARGSPGPSAKPMGTQAELWYQGRGTTGYGGVSVNWIGYGDGAFSADDFTNAVPWTIDQIWTDGFDYYGQGYQGCNTFSWFIYEDFAGLPMGYPTDGGGTEVWSYTTTLDAPEVTIGATGDVTVDLSMVGASVVLDPGHWWLVFYPTGANDLVCLYYWYFGITANLNHPQLIDPSNLFGAGFTTWTDWTTIGDPAYTDMTFGLYGSSGEAFSYVNNIGFKPKSVDPYRVLAGVFVSGTGTQDIPLPGADVTAVLQYPGGQKVSVSTTRPNGLAIFKMQSQSGGLWKLCVMDIQAAGYTYNPDMNVKTCGQTQFPPVPR